MVKTNSLYKKDEEIIINSKIEPEVNNDELFKGIKQIFDEDKKVTRDSKYFTISKCEYTYNIDRTIFSPNKLSLLQIRKFEELYLQQLESYIYNSKENIDTSKLFPIIYLFSKINKRVYPIKVISNNNNKLLPKVCNVLNIFFNKNYSVIHSIYTMFNSHMDTEKENELGETTDKKEI